MAKIKSKKFLKRIIIIGVIAIIGFFGYKYYKSKQQTLPEGIASGNGRLEAKLTDVAAKEALRVKKILVDEGDIVKPGQVVVALDTVTLEAELAEANASIAAAKERLAVTKASIEKKESELSLAKIEAERSQNLVRERAGSQRELDVRQASVQTTTASLAESEAMLKTAEQNVEVAKANAATIQTRIEDATLRSPVTGRVLYRLTEPGEVLAPGGKALTLVNLEDVYMEIFLPAEEAAKLKVGAEARITFDYLTDYAIPGQVSFVSPEAQFTPKQVETKSEREKLMFRVKIKIPDDLARRYSENIKTGVRGVGYVKIDKTAVWPSSLQKIVTIPRQASL